jgi:hypothetical protein
MNYPPPAAKIKNPSQHRLIMEQQGKGWATWTYHLQVGPPKVSVTAEAVEKANLLDHFIPDFFPSSIHPKSHLTDYNL